MLRMWGPSYRKAGLRCPGQRPLLQPELNTTPPKLSDLQGRTWAVEALGMGTYHDRGALNPLAQLGGNTSDLLVPSARRSVHAKLNNGVYLPS